MLIFKNCRVIELEDTSNLISIYQNQLQISMELYFGEKVENIADWFYPNHPEGLVVCKFYQIEDENGQDLFEFWNLETDSGTVFKVGSTKQTEIVMIQFYFEVMTSNSEASKEMLKKTAEELQQAYTNYMRNNA